MPKPAPNAQLPVNISAPIVRSGVVGGGGGAWAADDEDDDDDDDDDEDENRRRATGTTRRVLIRVTAPVQYFFGLIQRRLRRLPCRKVVVAIRLRKLKLTALRIMVDVLLCDGRLLLATDHRYCIGRFMRRCVGIFA